MRKIIFSLTTFVLLVSTSILFAQEKDKRAELDNIGGIKEISVSPDEKIFLTTTAGYIYFADNIYSSFNTIHKLIYEEINEFTHQNEHPILNRISFFNNANVIITGYIQSSGKRYSIENGFYYSKNGIKYLKRLCFGKNENEWIYDVFLMKEGIGWMGGSSGNIFYTSNFGKSWKKLNSPFNESSRTNSIFMSNSKEGIAGALENFLYITKNNWENYSKIETPFDQKLYSRNKNFSDNRIKKIREWGNYYLVNQDRKFFYSAKNKIEWKKFNIDILDFEIDRNSNNLYAITKEGIVIKFIDIDKYKTVYNKEMKGVVLDMKVVNNSVYLLLCDLWFNSGDRIAKINENEFYQTDFFTKEKKIEISEHIINGENLQWAFNNKYIYIKEINKQDWYREAQFNFQIKGMKLLNDSTAIIWDGKNNYYYSTSTHEYKLYYPNNPFSSFLIYPITKIEIEEGSQREYYQIEYNLNDSILYSKSLKRRYQEDSIFINQVNSKELTDIIRNISNNPQQLPYLKDFNITENNKKEYLKIIDTLFFGKRFTDYKKNKEDTSFFYDFVNWIDTLDHKSFVNVITKDIDAWSTARPWFELKIINSNNDTIELSNYWVKPMAYYFPLTIKYKDQYFNSYNLPLAQFISKCFPFSNQFENKKLLLNIADYYYRKKKQ